MVFRIAQSTRRATANRVHVASREHASLNGIHGRPGGWKYDEAGHPLYQGWESYHRLNLRAICDYYTLRCTAFLTFQQMVETPGSYWPTLLVGGRGGWRYAYLADQYDLAQLKRHDPRRAFRGEQ